MPDESYKENIKREQLLLQSELSCPKYSLFFCIDKGALRRPLSRSCTCGKGINAMDSAVFCIG